VETLSDRTGVQIAISDRGPGVAPEDQTRLFHSNFTRKESGMGFGLSIVRAIVEMHRGTVTHEPNVPHGAVFRVRLPAIGT
jgi:two-component system sensor kinase FixL